MCFLSYLSLTTDYDNNVAANVSTCLYSCRCSGMPVCGHIPAVRTGLNHRCVGNMCTLISIATMICLMQDGVTALYVASQEGHTEMVTMLLDKGADVDHPNKV